MRGQFLQIDCTWEYEEKLKEGTLILGVENDLKAVQAVWSDS